MKKLALLALVACTSPHLATTQLAVFTASPDGYDFGDVNVGATAGPIDLTISAGLGDSHDITSIDTSCPDFTFDTSAYSFPVTIFTSDTDAAVITIPVTFQPSMAGAQSCVVTITDANSDAITTTYYGNGVQLSQHLTLVTPTTQAIDFGEVPDGVASSTQTITIRNDGNADLTVSGANLLDGTVGLAVAGPTSGTVSPGATQDWSVTCTPLADGAVADTFRITSDDPDLSTLDIGLACTGVTTSIDLSPSPLVFPITLVGGTSAPLMLLVTNNGTAQATIQSITASPGEFVADQTEVGMPIFANGGSGIVMVTFAPDADGDLPGTLTITFDTETRNVALSGPGRTGVLQVTPDGTVDLGPACAGGGSATQAFHVRNAGTGTFNATPAITGDFAAALGSTDLAPGAAATDFDVTFTPTAAGPANGELTFTTNIPGDTPHVVTLAGLGLEAGVSATPESFDFGPIAPGALSSPEDIAITNCSGADIAVSDVAISGLDAASFVLPGAQPTTATVPNGQGASWTVQFVPPAAATGPQHATLDVTYDGGVAHVDLVGEAITPTMPSGGRGSYLACRAGAPADLALPLLALLYLVACSRPWRPKTSS